MYSDYKSYSHTVSARRVLNGVLLGFFVLAVVACWWIARGGM